MNHDRSDVAIYADGSGNWTVLYEPNVTGGRVQVVARTAASGTVLVIPLNAAVTGVSYPAMLGTSAYTAATDPRYVATSTRNYSISGALTDTGAYPVDIVTSAAHSPRTVTFVRESSAPAITNLSLTADGDYQTNGATITLAAGIVYPSVTFSAAITENDPNGHSSLGSLTCPTAFGVTGTHTANGSMHSCAYANVTPSANATYTLTAAHNFGNTASANFYVTLGMVGTRIIELDVPEHPGAVFFAAWTAQPAAGTTIDHFSLRRTASTDVNNPCADNAPGVATVTLDAKQNKVELINNGKYVCLKAVDSVDHSSLWPPKKSISGSTKP